MVDKETKGEIDKLRRRYRDLGESIEELLDAIARGTTSTDTVLSGELQRARMELASIARRLQGLQNNDD